MATRLKLDVIAKGVFCEFLPMDPPGMSVFDSECKAYLNKYQHISREVAPSNTYNLAVLLQHCPCPCPCSAQLAPILPPAPSLWLIAPCLHGLHDLQARLSTEEEMYLGLNHGYGRPLGWIQSALQASAPQPNII